MAAKGEVTEPVSSIDPRLSDPAAAAWEHAQRHSLTFEAAMTDVRMSIARREQAARRIREIRDEVRIKLAEKEGGQDGEGTIYPADELPESRR